MGILSQAAMARLGVTSQLFESSKAHVPKRFIILSVFKVDSQQIRDRLFTESLFASHLLGSWNTFSHRNVISGDWFPPAHKHMFKV